MKEIMDGNKACSLVSYNFIDAAGIYPITPASTMAEHISVFSNNDKLNYNDSKVKVVEMQSEAGAIAAVHGMLQNGIFASTYTASQGLLLMLPNMYKIAGELLPCVVNVAARTIATHALSIMGDHSDIYAARGTGFAIFASSSVQQVMDLTAVPYLSTIKSHVPFINFFDGFRTSHEYNKIDVIDYKKLKSLIDKKELEKFRDSSLDIDNPTTRGTNETDSIYFQSVEARNNDYNKVPDIVNDYLKEISLITGRSYAPFNYYGSKNATNVIVAMGSVCETIKEYIDLSKDKKIGLIEVHLYRPFSSKYLIKALPKTVKNIAVLDRCKEAGSTGEPLYLDVVEVISKYNKKINVYGGRFGLSSKNTNLNDIEAVYNYLNKKIKRDTFTIGIKDDLTDLSLDRTDTIFKKEANEILIYGYGSDGMVTASKDILTIVGDNTSKYVQGYFEYDSKKSGGVTKSHLRISNNTIRSTYYVENPKYVVLTKESYLYKYDVLDNIKEGGIFLLNTSKTINELSLPNEVIEILKNKNIKFYIIDANKIAIENNIPNKISMIMEMAIFKTFNLIDKNIYDKEIKNLINKNFLKKGKEIVNNNLNAIKEAEEEIIKVDVNSLSSNTNRFKTEGVFSYLDHLKGNELSVKSLEKYKTGIFEKGMSKLEKRGVSDITPSYDKDKCIMCNMCSLVCPHSVIRPYLLSEEEYKKAPSYVKESCKDAGFKDKNLYFTICSSPLDCTSCRLCEGICPTKAISMKIKKELEEKRFAYLERLEEKRPLPINTIKGSQFVKPVFSFSGACAGCGETPYLKLLSQLFKDNLMIANATGCSSIYGASVPSTPWEVPWINSLFEDNAEFGYGIRLAEDFGKNKVINIMKDSYKKLNNKNKKLVKEYLESYSKEVSFKVYNELDYKDFKEIVPFKKYIKEKSIWLVGGDGWAYDIGFGGIDHVLSNKENVNILVLDTEVYSNTGGQASKSTRCGAVAKFCENGKETNKKNLAKIAMAYNNAYVATISLGASPKQAIDALIEAEKYDGPSIVVAYSPCIAHGIKKGMSNSIKEEKLATESGYFPLFRYNPKTKELKTDSKSNFDKLDELFEGERRFSSNKDLLEKSKEYIKSNIE